ncbi:MFS transporter [Oerskovia enterophila]|uniref:Major facilitator superfamily protein n=1 Tax=Oerskovia enterophila TaxID=43678 RepID=A0ABX2Y444_9CELL|nr:MFS transporter [Oerskovia enterophila]OCI31319.1 major facilitator superfamily protein [Oerskovia enterophila]
MTLPSDSPSTAPVSAPTPTPAPAFAVDTSAAAEEFIEEASGQDDPPPLVRGTPRRLLGWIVPANFSVFMIWGAVGGLLMPLQVQLLGEEDKVANLAVVGTFGALAALLAQPVAGQISDRTRSRFGRRAPWLVLGALVGGLGLLAMGFASSLVGIVIGWMIVQIAYNFAQGPLSAIMPDRVPRTLRGTFAALSGLGLMLGALGGSILGAQFADSIQLGYLVFAGFTLIVLTLFVVFNPDHSSKDLAKEPFDIGEFLRTFWVSPRKHPDFFWAFTGRLLLYTGYFAVTGYQLFILQDYIGLGQAGAVAAVPLFSVISLAGVLVATLVSGPLSDRFQRRKVFVFLSSALVGLALLIPTFVPSFAGWAVFTFVSGLGFGMFQAVDTALMSEVLPSAKSFAKDLGVVNIAATLPQTLAPAFAGMIILSFGGYIALFPVGIVLSILGACAVWPIKAVR